MKLFKQILVFCFVVLFFQKIYSQSTIPLAGNAFITNSIKGSSQIITENGLENWRNNNTLISTYVKINNVGKLNLSINASQQSKKDISTIKVLINKKQFILIIKGTNKNILKIGTAEIKQKGYLKIDIQGIKKTGLFYPNVVSFIIDGAAAKDAAFANDKDNFYWSRRGPSCHLNYVLPKEENIEYFYSEITVAKGEDKIGSYFMANGFDGGYMGIQVNSETERRVLFSIWEEEGKPKTILNAKGKDVTDGRFDGEGTGGQSYFKYNWIAGNTYKFIIKATPDSINNKTDFSAWFYAPEIGQWKFIASWKKATTTTYLKRLHSFLENFEPENGYLGRKAFYTNQWAYTATGKWINLEAVKFTADATAKNNQRFDYAGGIEDGKFFLKNGGFFDEATERNKVFSLPKKDIAPKIDFDNLPIE